MSGFIQSTVGSGTGTSVAANAFGVDPTAGNMIVVGVEIETAAATNTSVTDNAGNTYTSDTNVSAAGQSIKVWKAYNITSTAGLIVTVHNSGSVSTGIIAQEFNGTGTSDPFDKTASSTGSSTALDSGSTATLSQADEIVIGFGTVDNVDTLTTGATYTNGASTTSANFRCRMESKVVAATTAVNATLTANSSGNWEMLVITFRIQGATTTSTSLSTSTSSTSSSTSTSSTSHSTSSTSHSTSSTSTSLSTSSTSSSISTSLSTSSTSNSTSTSTSISTSTSTSTTTSALALDIRPHGNIPRYR